MECILSFEDELPNDLMGGLSWPNMSTPAQGPGPGKTKQHQLNGTGGAGNGDGTDGSNCVPNIPQMHQHQLHHLMQQQQVSIKSFIRLKLVRFVSPSSCKVDSFSWLVQFRKLCSVVNFCANHPLFQ